MSKQTAACGNGSVSRALLDTDVIIWFLRGREETRRWVDQLKVHGVPCCSSLSVTEIVLGMRPNEEAGTRTFLEALDVFPPGREVSWLAGGLIRDHARQGVTLDFVDATIAATCLTHGLVLATYNSKHCPMPELERAKPTA